MSTALGASGARPNASTRTASTPPVLSLGDVAWLVVIPAALLTTGAVLLLGPPLGRALLMPDATTFWPALHTIVQPEPTEHARYLLALLGPLLLSAVAIALGRRGAVRSSPVTRALILGGQALVLVFVAVNLIRQHSLVFAPFHEKVTFRRVYFTWRTLEVATTLGLLLAVALGRGQLTARIARWIRERPATRIAAPLAAGLLTGTWLLTAVNSEGSVGNVTYPLLFNVPFWLEEAFSLLDGRAPLVDFYSQYGQLWPYLDAGVMSVVGASYGVYSAIMVIGSGAGLLAIFAVLRRVARSSLGGLALYLPFLANGLFTEQGPLANRYAPVNAYSMFPTRYAGPFLLAWLVARHLDRLAPRRRSLVFGAAGLVVANNLEFGVPALAATLAAILWTSPPRSPARAARLASEIGIGLIGAALLVCALTLAVAGSLPHVGLLLEFTRLYGLDGFGMLPMPALGVHLVLYLTFAAAIVVASVRAAGREEDVVLTGMLAWAGVFGLGAGGYYVGRSHPEVLIDVFSAWSLALVLLFAAVVRAVARRPSHRPRLAELAVLLGLGIAVCSLAQTPAPSSQIRRIGQRTPVPALVHTDAERFVARTTRPGEHVLILAPLGHRIAYELGLVDVAPFAGIYSMPAKEQMRSAIRALHDAHGKLVFIAPSLMLHEQREALRTAGFHLAVREDGSDVEALTLTSSSR